MQLYMRIGFNFQKLIFFYIRFRSNSICGRFGTGQEHRTSSPRPILHRWWCGRFKFWRYVNDRTAVHFGRRNTAMAAIVDFRLKWLLTTSKLNGTANGIDYVLVRPPSLQVYRVHVIYPSQIYTCMFIYRTSKKSETCTPCTIILSLGVREHIAFRSKLDRTLWNIKGWEYF